jgi:hypothetical protein
MANAINQYFQSVFSPPGSKSQLPPLIPPNFEVTKQGVLKLISELKSGKSPGPDQITKKILSLDPHLTSEILPSLFNLSIQTATLPDEWKLANITRFQTG